MIVPISRTNGDFIVCSSRQRVAPRIMEAITIVSACRQRVAPRMAGSELSIDLLIQISIFGCQLSYAIPAFGYFL